MLTISCWSRTGFSNTVQPLNQALLGPIVSAPPVKKCNYINCQVLHLFDRKKRLPSILVQQLFIWSTCGRERHDSRGEKTNKSNFQSLERWMSKMDLQRWENFFPKSEHIMLVLPQAAQLRIHFLLRKISSAAPPWRTWLRTHYWGIEWGKKAQHSAGIEAITSRVLLRRQVLYFCATSDAQKTWWQL